MVSEELKAIVEEIKKKGKLRLVDGASKEQIEAFEKKYAFEFPKQYREWLSFSDGGEFFSEVQLYGVAHKPLIDMKDGDKPSEDYVIIGTFPNGDPIVFKKKEEKISIYNHDDGVIEDDESYDDFFSFLKDLYNALGYGD